MLAMSNIDYTEESFFVKIITKKGDPLCKRENLFPRGFRQTSDPVAGNPRLAEKRSGKKGSYFRKTEREGGLCMQKKEEKKTNTQEKAVSIDTFEMVDRLVQNAQHALKEYMELDQEQVDKIVHAMTLAGLDKHMLLAKMAYEETGRGVMEDKVIKNIFSTEYIWHSIKKQKTVGVIDENEMAES